MINDLQYKQTKKDQLILVSIDLLNVLEQDLQFFLCYIVYLN